MLLLYPCCCIVKMRFSQNKIYTQFNTDTIMLFLCIFNTCAIYINSKSADNFNQKGKPCAFFEHHPFLLWIWWRRNGTLYGLLFCLFHTYIARSIMWLPYPHNTTQENKCALILLLSRQGMCAAAYSSLLHYSVQSRSLFFAERQTSSWFG